MRAKPELQETCENYSGCATNWLCHSGQCDELSSLQSPSILENKEI